MGMNKHASIAVALVVVLVSSSLATAGHLRVPAQIPVRDGKTLAADVYLPGLVGAWPAVLIQTPYDKRSFWAVFPNDTVQDPFLKSLEYAFVVVDWRGFFASSSAAVPGADRGLDGYDVVEWVARQNWCTGKVGTWGASALGVIQFQTASKHPPHLTASVPIVAHPREEYEVYFPGGVFARNRNAFVSGHFGGGEALRQHPTYDSLWQAIEAGGVQPEHIDVPMLHVSGWYDHGTSLALRESAAIRERGGSGARDRQWLLVGPWTHGGASTGKEQEGQLSYPAAAQEASREAKAFFDFFLRGVENGWDSRPFVRAFRINEDRWVTGDRWPSPAATARRFWLGVEGTLRATPPGDNAGDLAIVVDPSDPVPTLWGAIIVEGNGNRQGPGDLSTLETRRDVVTFTTEPLTHPLAIEGVAVVTVSLTCDAVDTDLAVRMTEVAPDGRSLLLVDGIRRASLRESYSERKLLEPGVTVRVSVTLPPVAVTIPAGHRLRLVVAPSNYDRFDVNMQDGSSLSDDSGATATVATVDLLVSSDSPAVLELPILPDARVRGRIGAR